MFDAACASEDCRTGTFITMCMHQYWQVMLGSSIHHDAQLTLCVNLLARIGIGQAGSLCAACFDNIDAAISVDINKQTKLVISINSTIDLTQARVGECGFPRSGVMYKPAATTSGPGIRPARTSSRMATS